MEDDEREYDSSEHEDDRETMDDGDEMELDHEGDEEENEEEEEEDGEPEEIDPAPDGANDADVEQEHDPDGEGEGDDETQDKGTDADAGVDADADGDGDDRGREDSAVNITTPAPSHTSQAARPSPWLPRPRPETVTAKLYDIVPTMAAPQATSINAISITPDQRYWMTGGSDGYIRKYDGISTINGKQLLTVAQRHPYVDSVVKAGVLMSYWENEEPTPTIIRGEEHSLSPVYSLAVHSGALWLLSGLESGGINLQSVRHDEGKRIHCLREGGHTHAVSALLLAPDEKSVLSGSWDKTVLDWDLNTGGVIRRYEGSGGQIAALELRPANAAPIPAVGSELEVKSETMQTNNGKPFGNNSFVNGTGDLPNGGDAGTGEGTGSPEHESLFGSPGGSLFGEDDAMAEGGAGAFGHDEDDEFSRAMDFHNDNNDNTSDPMHQPTDFSLGETEPATNGQHPTDAGNIATSSAHPDAGTNGASTVANGTNGASDDHDFAFESVPPPAEGYGASAVTTAPDQQFHTEAPSFDAGPVPSSVPEPQSPSMLLTNLPPASHVEATQASENTFLSASIDGTLKIWDRRMAIPAARINNRPGVPPWCMGACWSNDGNTIYVGRRNATVEEFSIHRARGGWQPERTLKLPAVSGSVSCVRPMPNSRHLMCASNDILRLYDLHDTGSSKHSKVPFVIVPGPPRAGVISNLYIDPTARIMITAAGTRGWEGSCTEGLIGYEINVAK